MLSRLLAIFIILLSIIPASAAKQQREVVVMVTIEGVSLEQIAKWKIPELRKIIDSGAIGFMSDKTDGAQNFESNAVTIGAGSRGLGTEYGGMAFNVGETAYGEPVGNIFKLNTGIDAHNAAIVHIGIASMINGNAEKKYEFIPGMLGQQLGKSGVAVAVYGNSDQGIVASRCGALIAMDTKGCVPHGDVGSRTLVSDLSRPYGVHTDYDYIFGSINALSSDRVFVVVEAGDSRRADVWKPYLSVNRYDYFKRQSVVECAKFINKLDNDLRGKGARYIIMFVVPAQESELMEKGYKLTPVMMIGTDINSGFLTSASTRRPGILTNLDLAPTVLHFFDIEPHKGMFGMQVTTVPETEPAPILLAMDKQMVETYTARVPVLVGFVVFVAISVILAIILMIMHGTSPNDKLFSSIGVLRILLIGIMLVPLAFQIAPVFHIYSALPSSAFVLLAVLSLSYFLNRWLRDPRLILGVVGIVIAAAICIDLVNNAKLLKHSILSYDPLTGIRMYGLGNESAGVLVGAVLLGVYSILDYFKRIRTSHLIVVGLICVTVAVIMGFPKYGTDFGGSFSVLVGSGAAFVAMREKRYRLKTLIYVAACGAIFFALVVGANMMLAPEKQSHIGRALNEARSNGISFLWEIALRKWAMSLHLMRYSVWTFVLVSLIPGLGFLFWKPVGILKQVLARHPMMNAGFIGVLVGVIMGLLTNDSGIAMAATGLIYLAIPLMFLVCVEMNAPQK